ncbi:MAG: AAA family ATPase [Pelolinea sp.]|nr:AAA family ATPase [Pelolinea sp.]
MKLRKLIIENFRGIHNMEWDLSGDMVCLVGPGDSTKSTILLALEYIFSPSWNLPVNDTDFYQMNVESPIKISAVITELPDTLISEDKFGLFLGFWNKVDYIHTEQQSDEDQKALLIRLTIKSDLEPEWEIISIQTDEREPQKIYASDRRSLGVARIGNYTEADLAWGRNSALSRLTQKEDLSQIPSMLAEAERNVIKALDTMDFNALSQSIQEVIPNAQSLGIDAQSEFRAGMDPLRINLRQGAIALFDGNLPLSLRGAGSRRLMVMAIHKSAVKEGAIILVDEIENSLEPYRLRHLIRQLRPKDGEKHQVIFTTHSSDVLVECNSNELYVTNSKDGKTTISSVGEDLQAIVRSIPEAFLCRKVVVCEGKTEAGLLISLDKNFWQERHQQTTSRFRYLTMAEAGVAPVESPKSGGTEAPKYAIALANLKYRVTYFGDSDCDLNPSEEQMKAGGVEEILIWGGCVEIERRLCLDFPLTSLKEFIDLAVDLKGNSQSVWDKIYEQLPKNISLTRKQDFDTLVTEVEEATLRECLGKAADKGEWFKRHDKGMALGKLLSNYLSDMQDTPTMATLNFLEKWCYE